MCGRSAACRIAHSATASCFDARWTSSPLIPAIFGRGELALDPSNSSIAKLPRLKRLGGELRGESGNLTLGWTPANPSQEDNSSSSSKEGFLDKVGTDLDASGYLKSLRRSAGSTYSSPSPRVFLPPSSHFFSRTCRMSSLRFVISFFVLKGSGARLTLKRDGTFVLSTTRFFSDF